MSPARGMFRPEPTIKHVRIVPETHMLQTIKHCVPRRKTLTRRATAERWESTIFRPTIYHQAFIHVCVKNYQIIVILEAKTLSLDPRTSHHKQLNKEYKKYSLRYIQHLRPSQPD